MKNKIVLALSLLGSIGLYAQTGINTPRPMAVFHVDGKGDNNLTGTITPAQIANDVVVTAEGNVGIGTLTPTNKLVIDNGAGTNTGLKLPNGAGAGAILTANADGSTYWDKSSTQSINFTSVIVSTGRSKEFYGSSTSWAIFNHFNIISIDNIKNVYGDNYGWNITNQRFVVPKTGKYRITLTVFFNDDQSSYTDNWRVIIAKNGEQKPITAMPYMSVFSQRVQQMTTINGIVELNKDDYFDIKVANITNSSRPVKIFAGESHTILSIEPIS